MSESHDLEEIFAPYQGDPIADFPSFNCSHKGSSNECLNTDRDDIPLASFCAFLFVFILQSVIFAVIGYGIHIGLFDEKFFRPKSKIPFFSHLYQEIEQEYEKPQPPPPTGTTQTIE
uniref:Uncharacterized protein n=1 Tax=Panagrolaimus sp. PS1159 TaxID=55785 RepID=A0AC35GDR5_9BILA